MSQKDSNLLASSPTLEGIQKLITRFYAGSTITLVRNDEEDLWTVHNRNGKIDGVAVQWCERKRFRFYRTAK